MWARSSKCSLCDGIAGLNRVNPEVVCAGNGAGQAVFQPAFQSIKPGDDQAFQAILNAGFERRATSNPLSCCVSSLTSSPPSEFDHQVDHVVTNMGKKAKLVNSSVTGLAPVNGFYDSDHAGVFSNLKLK